MYGLNAAKRFERLRHRPGVIIAETIRRGSPGVNLELLAFLSSKRYFVRGGSAINTIFVDLKRYG